VQVARPEATFERFYAAELEWARRLTFVLSGDGRFFDDLVQDAFLRLQQRFDQIDNPKAYLRVTLVNGVRRHHGRERQRQLAQEQSITAASEATAAYDELLTQIDRLPYRQRAVLVLRYFEDLSEGEIADVLGCREGTVKSLASRALAQLRKERS
jgi:RNA polymerase sigma factor (sigma-70 family)